MNFKDVKKGQTIRATLRSLSRSDRGYRKVILEGVVTDRDDDSIVIEDMWSIWSEPCGGGKYNLELIKDVPLQPGWHLWKNSNDQNWIAAIYVSADGTVGARPDSTRYEKNAYFGDNVITKWVHE